MEKDKSCPCTQGMRDLLMAAKPGYKFLKKIQCANCGKIVWVDRETNYCFTCEGEVKAQTEQPQKSENRT